MSEVEVHIIRVFEGPRHDRLRAIWDVISEFAADRLRLRWFANPNGRLRHAECLNKIWADSRPNAPDRMVITEADFLPCLSYDDWLLQRDLDEDPEVALAGVAYAKRKPGTRRFLNYMRNPGAWFMSFARSRCPAALDFDCPTDPAVELLDQLPDASAVLYPGHDAYPLHVGAEYVFGTHLFWSRHLHDDPRLRVSGYSLAEIQVKHDRAVDSWIKQQPQKFQNLLTDRLGSDILGSCSEYIDARSIFEGSSGKFDSSDIETVPVSRST